MNDEVRNNFRELMCELSDILEGGDVALDFEGYPAFVAVIESINAIVKHHLININEAEKFKEIIKKIKEMKD